MEFLDAMGWLNGATFIIIFVLIVLAACLVGLLANHYGRRNDHGSK